MTKNQYNVIISLSKTGGDFIFELDLFFYLTPPSVNTYWRRGRYATYLSPKGREFKNNVAKELEKYNFKKTDERLFVDIELNFKGKRKRDIDNYCKAILDSLNDIVWYDDEQIDILKIKKFYNCQTDGIKIKIKGGK